MNVPLATGEHAPRSLHSSDNLCHSGTGGVSHAELSKWRRMSST